MSFNFELYRLAEIARQKLLHHASQADHDLRSLVLHANLLDNLLLELNDENPSSTMTDRDTLPTLAAYHARLHGSTEPVILISEMNENARDDEDNVEQQHTFENIRSSAGSPPMLYHDFDSEPESSDDSDSDQDDDLEVEAVPTSPTSSMSEDERAHLKLAEKGNALGLGLHRTVSNWRLPLQNQ